LKAESIYFWTDGLVVSQLYITVSVYFLVLMIRLDTVLVDETVYVNPTNGFCILEEADSDILITVVDDLEYNLLGIICNVLNWLIILWSPYSTF